MGVLAKKQRMGRRGTGTGSEERGERKKEKERGEKRKATKAQRVCTGKEDASLNAQ